MKMQSERYSWAITKYFLLVFVPLVLLIGIVSTTLHHVEIRGELEIHKGADEQYVEIMRETISGDFAVVVSDLMILSEKMSLRDALDTGEEHYWNALAEGFRVFSERRSFYDEIRFLDETGMEIVRVNFNDGEPAIVPADQLQFMGERYYFDDTFRLEQGEVFVSPLDLSIDQPPKPMIRFGTPVFDSQGQKRGIVLLNYFGANLLQNLERMGPVSSSQTMLLNSAGFWLAGPNPEDEWGFMYADRGDRTFANDFPEAWRQITSAESGQFHNADGLFTFATVYPLLEAWRSSTGSGEAFAPSVAQIGSEEYYWKVVLRMPQSVLNSQAYEAGSRYLLLDAGLSVVLLLSSWFLARAVVNRQRAEGSLRESEARYRALSDNMSNGVAIYEAIDDGEDFIFVDFNKAGEQIDNIKRENLLGKSVLEIFPGVKDFGLFEVFRRVWATGTPEQHPVATYKDKRISGWRENFIYKLPSGEIVAVYSDKTERKQAEMALRESEEKYRTLTASIPDIIYSLGQDGSMTMVNEAFQDFFGYRTDEIVGQYFAQFIHPDDVAKVAGSFMQAMETHREYTRGLEFRVVAEDGVIYWVEISSHMQFDEDGNYLKEDGIIRDITERKRMEDALAQERELLRTFIDTVPDYVYVKDTEGRFLLGNVMLARSLGVTTPDELAGKTDFDFSLPELAAQYYADEQEVLRSGQPLINRESLGIDHAGNKLWMLTTKVPLWNEHGKVIGLVGITRDITERKQAAAERLALAVEREKMKILADFIEDVSHEFGTPLTVINTSIHLLGKGLSPEKQAKRLGAVQEQTSYIGDLVEAMLTMAHLDAGADHDVAPVNLNSLLHDLGSHAQSQIDEKGLMLALDLDGKLPTVQGDGERLHRALTGLVENAIRFTPEGGAITLGARPQGDFVVVKIADTGVGIGEEDLPRIFDRFYRVDAARTDRGAGLGLSIALKIIEAHGGRIEVESVVGEGSTFRILLPLEGAGS